MTISQTCAVKWMTA